MYVNFARLFLFSVRWTTSTPTTLGLYALTHISQLILVNLFRSKNAVSTPLCRIFRHTPAKGSPFLNVTRKMSPTLAPWRFFGLKSAFLAPVGSSIDNCSAVKAAIGSLHVSYGKAGGGWTLSSLVPVHHKPCQ